MNEKRFTFPQPITINQEQIAGVLVNDSGIFGVTTTGQELPVNRTTLAGAFKLDPRSDSFKGMVDLVEHVVTQVPLTFSMEKEDRLIGVTASGNRITLSLTDVKKKTGIQDNAILLRALTPVLNGPSAPRSGKLLGEELSVGSLVSGLANGLAGHIGGFLAGAIIDAIFPQKSLQSYFDDLYDRLKILVHEEIVTNQIQIINAKIDGTEAFIRNEYLPRKKQIGQRSQDLLDLLQPFVADFFSNVTFTLQTGNNRKPGFGVFLLGALLHLLLIQEEALVDPTVSDPRKSSFAETVKRQAQEYHDRARDTWKDVAQARRDQVVSKVETVSIALPFTHEMFVSGTIIDKFTNTVVLQTYDLSEWVCVSDRKLSRYRNRVVNELSNQLASDGGVEAVLSRLQEVINQPIPQPTP
jgi:hypothetical protein